MNKARIHNENIDIIVSAEEVLNGQYDRHSDFVDPEYEFRVTFVSVSKNHGSPYFRLYFSLEDYQNMTPERKTRYDILRDQYHFAESKWHREWEDRVSSFCKNEYYIKNPNSSKYKRTDAFCESHKLCIEFQHSYIANDFNERNKFYSQLGYKVIWLYDLTKHEGKVVEDIVELVEDNACGFFRIAEEDKDLKDYPVFIEVKGGRIFKVEKLLRKEIEGDKQSTIRFFNLSTTFENYENFVEALKTCDESLFESKPPKQKDKSVIRRQKTFDFDNCKSIAGLWDESYSFMVVLNTHTSIVYFVFGKEGQLIRDYQTGKIRCKYAYKDSYGQYREKGTYYNILDENERIWALLHYAKDKGYEERIARERSEKEKAKQERIAKMKETKRLKAAEQEDCQTLFQLTRECNGRYLYVDNVLTGKRYFLRIVVLHQSFNIYEVDKENVSIIMSSRPLNAQMACQYRYKLWKKADV